MNWKNKIQIVWLIEENTKIDENKRIFIDSRSCTYRGYKLFIDNTLGYGEIELR